MTTELTQFGTMPEAQLNKIQSYISAQRLITDRRRVLETIFGQEMLQYNNRILTGLDMTLANLDGMVSTQEIKFVDETRNCRLVDEDENFLLNQNIASDLTTYGLHPSCISCRWGINGEGGHNTGCPRLELTAPLYLELDNLLRPETIHLEIGKIKYPSLDKLNKEMETVTTAQDAYTILAKSCPDTGLPWYRYTFGLMHMGTYSNMPLSIYNHEQNFRQNKNSVSAKTYNLLDIGCGEGTLTKRIASIPSEVSLQGIKRRLFDKVVGIDINKAMISAAKKHNNNSNIDYIIGNFAKIPDLKFDAITFNGLSPYITYQQAEELNAIFNRILVPGGRLYTSGTIASNGMPVMNKYMVLARSKSFYNCIECSKQVWKTLELADKERHGKEIALNKYFSTSGYIEHQSLSFPQAYYPTLDPNYITICFVKK